MKKILAGYNGGEEIYYEIDEKEDNDPGRFVACYYNVPDYHVILKDDHLSRFGYNLENIKRAYLNNKAHITILPNDENDIDCTKSVAFAMVDLENEPNDTSIFFYSSKNYNHVFAKIEMFFNEIGNIDNSSALQILLSIFKATVMEEDIYVIGGDDSKSTTYTENSST